VPLANFSSLPIVLFFFYRKSFGENNVQTAKHYGNLGRLYQSMRRYEVTENKNKHFNKSTLFRHLHGTSGHTAGG